MRPIDSPWTLMTALIVAGLASSIAGAASGPSGVSPGRLEEASLIDTRCPTFSWTAQPDAAGYEIVVLEWAPGGPEEREPALRQSIPGGAVSWTPALDQCLEWGVRYAWSVSAQGTEGGWSKPLLFQVASPETALGGGSEASSEGNAETDRGEEPAAGAATEAQLPASPSPSPTAPATGETRPSSAPASNLMMVGGIPVTLESYDHSMVFDKQSGAVPQVTTTSFVELGNVSIELDDLCTGPLFVTRWNLLVIANAVAFSLEGADAAQGDLAVSVDDPTGTNVGNGDVQSFSVDGLLTDTSLAGISLFTMLQDVSPGTRAINLLARRDNGDTASFAFNNYRLGVMALGFDCELIFPP